MFDQRRLAFASVGRQKKNHLKQKIKVIWNHEREKRKAGRPAQIIKKEVRTAVRFSKTEYFIIRQKASKAGVKPSAFIRQIAVNGEVTRKIPDTQSLYNLTAIQKPATEGVKELQRILKESYL